MKSLTRISLRYVAAEDRIRLRGEDGDGVVEKYWLTRRLSDRLFAPLTQWVEQADRPPAPAGVAQVFAQHEARASLRPGGAVAPGARQPGHLIARIDVTPVTAGLRLILAPRAPGAPAQVVLPAVAVRQWLDILTGQYLCAGWPTDAVPAWVRAAHMDGVEAPREGLH